MPWVTKIDNTTMYAISSFQMVCKATFKLISRFRLQLEFQHGIFDAVASLGTTPGNTLQG